MDSLPVKPRDVCPHCGYVSDCHTAVGKVPAVPHNGDFSFCIDCGQWAFLKRTASACLMREKPQISQTIRYAEKCMRRGKTR